MSINRAIENAVAYARFEGMQVDDECIKYCKELWEHKIETGNKQNIINFWKN